MRVVDRDGTLVVQDSPGLHWLLGLMFLVVGVVFVAGPLGLFRDRDRVAWYARSLAMLMGGAGVAARLWVLRESAHSTLEVERRRDRVRLAATGSPRTADVDLGDPRHHGTSRRRGKG